MKSWVVFREVAVEQIDFSSVHIYQDNKMQQTCNFSFTLNPPLRLQRLLGELDSKQDRNSVKQN